MCCVVCEMRVLVVVQKTMLRRSAVFSSLLCALLGSGGCHSAFVGATLVNHSGQTVRLLEMDYPSASFGTEQLENCASFKYRFKIMGKGNATLSWTDSSGASHNSRGPALAEGQEGRVSVEIGPNSAEWQQDLHQ